MATNAMPAAAGDLSARLVDGILDALAGEFTQRHRLLRLHTPLGPDVLLAERARLVEAIGPDAPEGCGAEAGVAGSRFVIECLATDTALELKRLMGQPVLLELLTQHSRSELRPFHGHVTAAELLGSDGGLARYRLTVEPWLALLDHRQDSFVFQGQTVVQIIESVFSDYAGQARLAPDWRWDLADASVYPQRSLCLQYQESDLAFVQRLLREEGLFCWWEHTGDAASPTRGRHTLVIADHNGAFGANRQDRVRYTQSGTVLPEDSLTRWREGHRVHTAALELASRDHRTLSLRPVTQGAAEGAPGVLPALRLADVPGAYAYEDRSQGERLALRQMQALDAARHQAQGVATLRQAAPGSHWCLTDHPRHDGRDDARDRFVTLAVRHQARNNLRADLKARLDALLPRVARDAAHAAARDLAASQGHAAVAALAQQRLREQAEEAPYQCRIDAQPLAVPVRPAARDADGLPDPRLNRRPTIHGVQTAIVVGAPGADLHTDRDHRIKIQFHWQRGDAGSHRLAHPRQSNAPGDDGAGTWVRVAERVAGANWGSHFVPRVGQEVLVAFVAGDIDRPVVIGSLYNGQGAPDAQGNQRASGAAGASGNANAWFPGTRAQGALQAHAHAQVHAGFKTQELGHSQSGSGGHNRLVFDDSPGANRIELASTSAATRLQLGHLLDQADNQRLQARGHGLDLSSSAWGAVRAGAGLLLSAHAQPPSAAGGQQLTSREPQSRLQQGQEIVHALAQAAQAHNAQLPHEPAIAGATPADRARQLPVEQGLWATQASLKATARSGGDGDIGNASADIGGGHGVVAAWSRPDLLIAAPDGIASVTPAHHIVSAGATCSAVAGQDIQRLAQGHHASAAKCGISLFADGQASDPNKPNAETGIRLHAASGSVSSQSQSGGTTLIADKNIDMASTAASVSIAAPGGVRLTAGGAAIEIQGGSITLTAPGTVSFKAGMKVLAGPGRASSSLSLPPVAVLQPPPDLPFASVALDFKPVPVEWLPASMELQAQAIDSKGGVLGRLSSPADLKHSSSVRTAGPEPIKLAVRLVASAWVIEQDTEDPWVHERVADTAGAEERDDD